MISFVLTYLQYRSLRHISEALWTVPGNLWIALKVNFGGKPSSSFESEILDYLKRTYCILGWYGRNFLYFLQRTARKRFWNVSIKGQLGIQTALHVYESRKSTIISTFSQNWLQRLFLPDSSSPILVSICSACGDTRSVGSWAYGSRVAHKLWP